MDKKELRRSFLFLGLVLILYEIAFNVGGLLGSIVPSLIIVAVHPEMTTDMAIDFVYEAGYVDLFAAILGTIVVYGLYRQMPDLSKNKKISVKTVIVMLLLIDGIQMIGNFLVIGMDYMLSFKGYDTSEAVEMATAVSVHLPALFYSVIAAPVCEELLFRGIIMKRLETYGKAFALIMSALIFGLIHQNIIQLPITFGIGIIFGLAAMEYSLPAAIAIHIINNLNVELYALGDWYILVSALLMYIGLAVFVVTVIRRRKRIEEYIAEGKAKENVLSCFFTSPTILVWLVYMIYMTIMSITAI